MLKQKLSQPLLALCLLLLVAPIAAFAQETLPELIKRVKPSVVTVITYNDKGDPLVTGSGFFIRPGHVITNLHVMEGARRAEVRTFDGKGKTYPVTGLLNVDEDADLALLSIDIPHERARSLEVSSELPEEGEQIFVIGNPLRLEGSVSDGIVSAVREVPNLGKIIQITAPISHGNSGSPLFNMKGQVIGVVTIKVTNGQNINLAMAASRVTELQPQEKLLTLDELAAKNRSAHQKRPEVHAEWSYRNGLNSLWLGNYESALSFFENAVNQNPTRVEAWIQVGYCNVKQGKNSDAIRAYQQAIKLRPNSVDAHNRLGDAYYYAGSFDKAIESYRQAVRLQPRMAEAYYNLGMAYLEIGDRASAIVQTYVLKSLDTAMYNKLLGEIHR